MKRARGLFVAGTDTGVGKTRVVVTLIEALKQKGYRVAGMKPIAAGLDEAGVNEDVIQIMQASNVAATLDEVCPYRFALPIAPHIAAQQTGVTIELGLIEEAYNALTRKADWVVVEGAGGFLVPLDESLGMDAIPARLALPVVLVVGMKLGCLNHALLTQEAMRSRGLKVAGWVANQIDPDMRMLDENIATLRQRIKAEFLGVIAWTSNATNRSRGLELLRIEQLINSDTSTKIS